MLTDSDMEILTGYRCNVISINVLKRQAAWNDKFCLPVDYLYEKISALCVELEEFERILDRIDNRRTRVIFQCKYAAGMTEEEIAEKFHIEQKTVCNAIKKEIS